MSERRVSAIGALLVALGPISLALFTPLAPDLVRAFDTTESAVKFTLSLYFAGFAIGQLVCGPLSDALGRKPIVIAFLLIYVLASLAALLSPNIELLIAARALQGFGAAAGLSISRAVARDLFSRDQAARVFNLIGVIMATGPALAPTLGGFTLALAGWRANFWLMLIGGSFVLAVVIFALRETVTRDVSRMNPPALVKGYGQLLRSPYFTLSCAVMSGAVGVLYAQTAVLPFVLMSQLGLSPLQYGLAMLIQSTGFLIGALAMRVGMRRFGLNRMVPVGLCLIAAASLSLALLLRIGDGSFLKVMIPISIYASGVALVMPAMTTATLLPYPSMAGTASSLAGFLQISGGFVGGLVATAIGDPTTALATVSPSMGLIAVICWLIWRRLPQAQVLQPPPKIMEIDPKA